MNVRLLILLFAFITMPSMAVSLRQKSDTQVVERSAILKTLQRGSSFTRNNQTYQYLPEVRAVLLKSKSEPLPQALQRVGATADQVIETKGTYALYRGGQRATAQIEKSEDSESYPAVLNTRTKVIGVLPGTIEVRPKGMGAVSALAAKYGLRVVREFVHLGVVYYQVQPGLDLFAIANALAADPQVFSSGVEIVEHLAVPH